MDVLERAGDHAVGSQIVCALTRFRFRDPWGLLVAYIWHRRLRRQARSLPGHLRSAFLIEDFWTGYSLSLWRRASDIGEFNVMVPEHVDVARRAFGWVRVNGGRPEVWSTKWRLTQVSNNLCWPGLDLRAVIRSESATVSS